MSTAVQIDPVQFQDLEDLISALAGTSRDLDWLADGGPWATVVELGLTAVSVPEELGGAGGSFLDETVVAHAAARYGLDLPLVEGLVTAWVLASFGPVEPGVGAVAVVHRGTASVGVTLGRQASAVVLVDPDGCVGVVRNPVFTKSADDLAGHSIDELDLVHSEVEWHDSPDLAGGAIARLAALRAAQILGAVEAALDLSRIYTTERLQFGKPLNTIPAVAASLARMRTQALQLRACVERAAMRIAAPEDHGDAALVAALVARVAAGRAASEVAARAHQVHGALGITAEYELGRYTRRLWTWRDADLADHAWADWLGRICLQGGEERVWDDVTRPW